MTVIIKTASGSKVIENVTDLDAFIAQLPDDEPYGTTVRVGE